MEIAALVLGIIAFIVSFIPGCGLIIGIIPAIVGLILGIVALAKKKEKKGMSIAGLILSALSILIMIGMIIIVGAGSISALNDVANSLDTDMNTINSFVEEIEDEVEESVEDEEINVGETYKDDEVSIKYVSVDENFTGYNSYATVEEGCKIIKLEFEVENLSTSNMYISSYDFDCYADQYDCDRFYSVSGGTFSSTLSAGKKTKGSVYFEVPTDATEITVEYEIDSLTDKKAIFIVK